MLKGAATYNLKLSKQRAAAVVGALEARGVNPATLKSIGIGSQEATVPATASDAERQQDRKSYHGELSLSCLSGILTRKMT